MAIPTKPLGSSRLILTLAVMISIGFGAAVLTPSSEQQGTASASPVAQRVILGDNIDDDGVKDAKPRPTVPTDPSITAQVIDTSAGVQLPANPRETKDRADPAAPATAVPRTTRPTLAAKPTTTAAPLVDPDLDAISVPTGLGHLALANLPPTTTTTQIEPVIPSTTTVVPASGAPSIDPQRCTVSLINGNTAEVTWSGATAPDGYEIRRNNVVIGSALTTATSFTDATLSKTGTEYHFSVSSIGSGDKTWCGFVVVPTGPGHSPGTTSCRSWQDPNDSLIWWIAVSNTGAGSSLLRNGTVIAHVSDANPQITVSDRPIGRPTYEIRSGAETVSCL